MKEFIRVGRLSPTFVIDVLRGVTEQYKYMCDLKRTLDASVGLTNTRAGIV
jgi:hypothetical protein